jgi:hypothetical protein
MILYNVTVNIDHAAHDEWLQWMKTVHIPDVMNTGMFTQSRIFRLHGDEDSGGTTYSIQYYCESMKSYEKYRDEFAPALQQEVLKTFGDKFVAFRSILELVD